MNMETAVISKNNYSEFDKFRHNQYSNSVLKFADVGKFVYDKKPLESSDTFKSEDNILGAIDKNVVDIVVKPDKTPKQRVKAYGAVGASVLALGGVTLLFNKGRLSKGITSFLGKVVEKAVEKTEKIAPKEKLSALEGFSMKFFQNVRKGASMLRGTVFNFAPFKDVWFQKVMTEKCGLRKPCEALTEKFKRLSLGTVKKAYRGAYSDIEKMNETFSKVNKRILGGEFVPFVNPEKSRPIVSNIEERMGVIRDTFKGNFTEAQIVSRSDELTSTFFNLGARVYDKIYGNLKGFIGDSGSWSTFVSEAMVAKDKSLFMTSLADKRRIVTNSPRDNYNELVNVIEELEMVVNPNHSESRSMLKTLRKMAKQYKSYSGPNKSIERKNLGAEITKYIEGINIPEKSSTYNKEELTHIGSLLRRYGKVINGDKKGQIEEILTWYKKMLPAEDYVVVHDAAKKASKSLNKAVYREGFEYVDKLRDFATGSALTDVAFGMAVPTVSTAVALGTAKTKEKKKSVLVKFALPLFVGIGTATMCTVKLISAGKALLLGGATSILTSGVSEFFDRHQKMEKIIKENKDIIELEEAKKSKKESV